MSTESYNSTTFNCQRFKCSGRGLILPFGIEACMSIQLRAVLYFVFLLYLFLGIAIIADIFMSAIETITSRKQKIRYPDPGEKDKYLTVEVRVWNDTVANLTLMALGSSSPEILLSIIEIVGNRFEAGELGPGTIVGSAAYNLLMISAICIASINAPETRRIKLYNVFLVTSFFGFFAYIWLFIVLSVISKDVVELWEAVLTFLMFPLVVILAYLAEKNCFASKKIEMAEEEKLIITPPETDAAGVPRSFHKDELLQFLRDLGQSSNLSIEDKAQLFAAKLSENMHRSRMQYRIQGARMLTGGKSLFVNLPDKLQEIYEKYQKIDDESSPSAIAQEIDCLPKLEFTATAYAVLENEQRIDIIIKRTGPINVNVRFRLDTIDGTATAGEDYIKLSEEFVMESGQQEKKITIHVIDDNQWEPDETFFVKLSLPESEENHAKVGSKTVALVTIINDDEPGYIHFEEPINLVKESVGKAEIKVARVNGADGRVSVHYRTKDIEAVATRDYEPADSELVFEHGEISKIIAIPIMNDLDTEKDETFAVELYNPTGGATIGKHGRTVVTIINDDNYITMANKMASLVQVDIDKLSVTKTTWGQQFKDAMTVNGGDLETAKFLHYVGHTFSFFWKILFAFVPPTSIAGGWLTFFVSLLFIAILTAVVGDVAAIFGCLVGLKDSITAISFVALGTSLPDTFASMIAAKNSKTADDAIGNVTGSNSVNVFLGLGLPWLVAAVYWESKNLPFTVKAGDLSFSVLVFSCSCIIGMILLTLRRFLGVFGKAELGGPTIPKYACSAFFVFLWICYLTLSGLQAYGHIYWAT
ncbi:unnamed protein product [Rotaria socialis]|uniref:Calx-beta domain-containing protein n=1 Tax=Rotaria socialis TaxID=392032 RepID=A0A818SGV3_9BILA|nr:unnamed protein product [Rotaria socialis]CAF3671127.1 unnamed protein product [Rotaria socialis]CAF3745389.1 unnamed protein product [Rotaria socialis]